MSRYAWEHGTITLPTGQPAQLRAALQRAADAQIAALTAETDRAWNRLRTMTPAQRADHSRIANDPIVSTLSEQAHFLMCHWERRGNTSAPRWRKPSQKAIRESVITRHRDGAGKTHTVFRCGLDATITLAGNTVTWDVSENNHAPERAHAHPLAASLFRHLHAVQWTSRSGGIIVGNDEYARDDRDVGGGGNYTVESFGAAPTRGARALVRR